MTLTDFLLPVLLTLMLCLVPESLANQHGVYNKDYRTLQEFQFMGDRGRDITTMEKKIPILNGMKSMTRSITQNERAHNERRSIKANIYHHVPSSFVVVMVIEYKLSSFTKQVEEGFLNSISKQIHRKAVSCHLWRVSKRNTIDITVNFYCIHGLSRPGTDEKKSFAAVMFVPGYEIVRILSSGPMRGFLQKYNVTKYFVEGDPRGITIAYAVTNEVWFPVAVVASASCLLVIAIVCIVVCCRRTPCLSPETGHVDKSEHKHERLVFSPVKPMDTMTPKMVQPDIGTLYTISGSPPKAQKWTASGEIRRGLYQSRRGSQASLVIDLSPVTKSPLIDQGHESPTEETLSNNSRPLTYHDLKNLKDDEKALYFEFWSIPSNTASRKDREFQSSLKNRYPDIIPNKKSIVKLEQIGDDTLSTYINANFITGYNYTKSKYIATEGPLQSTTVSFWRMIWQYRCPIIVMITKLKEKNEEKCSEYWPTSKTKRQQTYGDIIVTHDSEISRPGYKITTLYINHKDHDTPRPVLHYWFTSWPDHKVPKSCSELIAMAKEVQAARNAVISADPIVIHCSAGRGRTGCFIAIGTGMEQIEAENSVDILNIVSSMRIERGGLVQKDSQYIFIHKALYEYWTEARSSSPSLQNSESIEEAEEMKEKSNEDFKKAHFVW